MTIHTTTRITVQEFERIAALPANQDRLLELINGEIIEKMPTEEHGRIVLRLGGRLIAFVEEHKLGIASTEAAHHMPDQAYQEVRPDIFFIAGERDSVKEGSIPRMPDLAVEVRSPNNTIRSLRDKADYYLLNGSQMVWLIFPDKHIIEVYTPDGDDEILQLDDVLDGGTVIPGFQVPLRVIFGV